MCLVGDGIEEIPDTFQWFKIYGSIFFISVEEQGKQSTLLFEDLLVDGKQEDLLTFLIFLMTLENGCHHVVYRNTLDYLLHKGRIVIRQFGGG